MRLFPWTIVSAAVLTTLSCLPFFAESIDRQSGVAATVSIANDGKSGRTCFISSSAGKDFCAEEAPVTCGDLYVTTEASLSTPPGGRVAIPAAFGYEGLSAPQDAVEVWMTVLQGFTWAATASIAERVNDTTVRFTFATLPKRTMTKARLLAAHSWDNTKPVLKIEMKCRNGGTNSNPENSIATSLVTSKLANVDLFMFPPPSRTTGTLGGKVSYNFTIGNQGSSPASGKISASLLNGATWAETPSGCSAASSTAPMTCLIAHVSTIETFQLTIRAPTSGSGIIPAVQYSLDTVDGVVDDNPTNNGGTRFVGLP